MKNQVIIRNGKISCLFLIFLISSAVVGAADISFRVNNNGEISSDDDSQTIQQYLGLEKDLIENVDKISGFVLRNFIKGNPYLGEIIIDENTGLITVVDSNGKNFAEIPKGYKFDVNSNNEIIISGKSQQASYTIKQSVTETDTITGKTTKKDIFLRETKTFSLFIDGLRFDSISYTSFVLSNERGYRRIKINGEGNIAIGDNVFRNIADATIDVDRDSKIQYADFISKKQRTFSFYYNGLRYDFRAKKDGRVTFDSKNGLIKGKNADLTFGAFNEFGDFIYEIRVNADEFSLLADNEQIKKITISANGEFFDYRGTKYTSTEQFEVYDKSDIKDKKNAISITSDGIYLRGKINVLSENLLSYNGISENSYALFNQDKNNFDVISGDAVISNGKHIVLVDNGNLKLGAGDLVSDIQGESFSISHINKQGIKEIGILDENFNQDGGRFVVGIMDKEGNYRPVVSEKLLDRETFQKKILQNSIKSLSDEISRLEKEEPDSEELAEKKLGLLMNENRLSRFNKNYREAIERTERFLKEQNGKLESGIGLNLRLSLGELNNAAGNQVKTSGEIPRKVYISQTASAEGQEFSAAGFYFQSEYSNGKKVITGFSKDGTQYVPLDSELNGVPEAYKSVIKKLREDSSFDTLRFALSAESDLFSPVQSKFEIKEDNQLVMSSEKYLLMIQRFEKAKEIFQSIRNSNPVNSQGYLDASFSLAKAYMDFGDFDRAFEEYDKLRLSGDSDEIKSKALQGMAITRINQGRGFWNAQQYIKESGETDPKNSEAEALRSRIMQQGFASIYSQAGKEIKEFYGYAEDAIGFRRTLSLGASNEEVFRTFEGKTEKLGDIQIGALVLGRIAKKGRIEGYKQAKTLEEKQDIIAEVFALEPEDRMANRFALATERAELSPDIAMVLADGNFAEAGNKLKENGVKIEQKEGFLRKIIIGNELSDENQIFNEPRFISNKPVAESGILNNPFDKVLVEVNLINAALLFGPNIILGATYKGISTGEWASLGARAGIARLPTGARLLYKDIASETISAIDAVGIGIGESRIAQAMPGLTKLGVAGTVDISAGLIADEIVPGSGLPVMGITHGGGLLKGIERGLSGRIILTKTEKGFIEAIEGRAFESEKSLSKFLEDVQNGNYKGLEYISEYLVKKDGRSMLVYAEGKLPKNLAGNEVLDSLRVSQYAELASEDAALIQMKYAERISQLRERLAIYARENEESGIATLTKKISSAKTGETFSLQAEPDIIARESMARAAIDSNREVAVVGNKMIVGNRGMTSFKAGDGGSESWWHVHTPQGAEINSNIIPSGATTPMGRLTFFQLPTSYNPGVGAGDFGEAIANEVKELKIGGIVDGSYKELSYRVPSAEDYLRWAGNPQWKKVGGIDFNEPLMRYSLGDDWEKLVLGALPKNSLENNLYSPVRQIDLDRIGLVSEEISRIKSGSFNAEELERINAAENSLGRRLSDKQKAEVILSHNAGNELYGIDDFARVSTKARLLEDFSSYERRVLMKNWVTGTSPEFKLHSAGFSDEETKIFLSEARGYDEKTRIVEGILSKPRGSSSVNYQLTSVVKKDDVLLKEANRLGADDSKDINNMLDVLIRGGNPGIGLRNLGNGGISYARARDGARVFFKLDVKNKKIIIVGYSNKNNEDKVIKRLQTLYP